MALKHLLFLIVGYYYYDSISNPLLGAFALKTDQGNIFDFLLHMSPATIWSYIAACGFLLLLTASRSIKHNMNALMIYTTDLLSWYILHGFVVLLYKHPRLTLGWVVCICFYFGTRTTLLIVGLMIFGNIVGFACYIKILLDSWVELLHIKIGTLVAELGLAYTAFQDKLARLGSFDANEDSEEKIGAPDSGATQDTPSCDLGDEKTDSAYNFGCMQEAARPEH